MLGGIQDREADRMTGLDGREIYRVVWPRGAGTVKAADVAPRLSTLEGKTKIYLKDEQARQRFLVEKPNHKAEFNRLKGLGEMDWEELGSTTMDATKRTLLRVDIEQAALADEVCSILMGDDVEQRKHFITTNAGDVRFLDI